MVIAIIVFIIFILKENIGQYILILWMFMWLITQFLSHEWYTIFGNGFMGTSEEKIAYFKDSINFFDSVTVYIPDVYHIILHVLIVIALGTTIIYCVKKKDKKILTSRVDLE